MDAEALAVSAEPDTGLAAFHLMAPAAANSAPPVDALFTAMLLLCDLVRADEISASVIARCGYHGELGVQPDI